VSGFPPVYRGMPEPSEAGGGLAGRMGAPVMECRDLDVFDVSATVSPFVFNPHVRELDLVVHDR
jgi:hypothetical protein